MYAHVQRFYLERLKRELWEQMKSARFKGEYVLTQIVHDWEWSHPAVPGVTEIAEAARTYVRRTNPV